MTNAKAFCGPNCGVREGERLVPICLTRSQSDGLQAMSLPGKKLASQAKVKVARQRERADAWSEAKNVTRESEVLTNRRSQEGFELEYCNGFPAVREVFGCLGRPIDDLVSAIGIVSLAVQCASMPAHLRASARKRMFESIRRRPSA